MYSGSEFSTMLPDRVEEPTSTPSRNAVTVVGVNITATWLHSLRILDEIGTSVLELPFLSNCHTSVLVLICTPYCRLLNPLHTTLTQSPSHASGFTHADNVITCPTSRSESESGTSTYADVPLKWHAPFAFPYLSTVGATSCSMPSLPLPLESFASPSNT